MNERLKACCVSIDGTLRDGLQSLERGRVQIALAVDDEGSLIGTLTDGDVRRALLRGDGLEQPLSQMVSRKFVSAAEGTDRAEVLELMQARMLGQIPVISAEGRLVGLHTLHELLGNVARPNWAVIMAGGIGRRLWPLTENVPKPMITVAGKPILERLVLQLVGYGIQRIFLAVRYKAEVIEQHFGTGDRFGCRIEYLREDEALGTAGALSLLPEAPTAPLLVMNGDLVAQLDVPQLLSSHDAVDAALTIAVHSYTHAVPFGVVEIEDGRVKGIREKPTYAWETSAGIYVLSPEVLGLVPAKQEFQMPMLVDACLRSGLAVHPYALESEWIDVGRAPELQRARQGS